jgi:serine/threonine protein kinase
VIETDLADRGTLENYPRLVNPNLMDMMFQLCFSLMQMKKASCFIHRDIKPSNVIIYRNRESINIKLDGKCLTLMSKYRIVLVDFGVSSTTSYSRRLYYRPQCWKVGTWFWNPPMIGLYHSENDDINEIPIRSFQSDIWSIGMVALSISACMLLKRQYIRSYVSLIENNNDIQSCTKLIGDKINWNLDKRQILLLVCCSVIQKSIGNEFLPNYSHKFGTCYHILKEIEENLDKSVIGTKKLLGFIEMTQGSHVIKFIKTCLQWNQEKTLPYKDILRGDFFNHLWKEI